MKGVVEKSYMVGLTRKFLYLRHSAVRSRVLEVTEDYRDSGSVSRILPIYQHILDQNKLEWILTGDTSEPLSV